MYSGLVLTKYSGQLMGAHQKIDRIARRHLSEIIKDDDKFPSIKEILSFEGKNGPDGIKKKSPGHNEPWHFFDPLGEDTAEFLGVIDRHFKSLSENLKQRNRERAAFEAAWFAHAIVDGLTPAHHYPYEEKVSELRNGEAKETRDTVLAKLIFVGDTPADTVVNTAKAYGPGGLLTSHGVFEFCFTMLIRPLRLPDARPTEADFEELKELGHTEYFLNRAKEVAVLDLFERYMRNGWTPKLSNQIRHELAPTMVKTVTMMWYGAAIEAGLKPL